jgi:hypothetical protein
MPVCALTCQVVDAHHVDKAYRLCREGSLHGRTYPLFADHARRTKTCWRA